MSDTETPPEPVVDSKMTDDVVEKQETDETKSDATADGLDVNGEQTLKGEEAKSR